MKTQVLQEVADARVIKQHDSNVLRAVIEFSNGETFTPKVGSWTEEGRDFSKLLYKKLDEETTAFSARRRRVGNANSSTETERVILLNPEKVVIGYEPYKDLDGNKSERRLLVGGEILEVKTVNLVESAKDSLEKLLKKSTKAVAKRNSDGDIIFVDEEKTSPKPKSTKTKASKKAVAAKQLDTVSKK